MNRIALLLPIAAVASAIALSGCAGDNTPYAPDPDQGYTHPDQLPPDPYSNNGIWKVPEQIKPGRYEVHPGPDGAVTLAWIGTCVDEFCEEYWNPANVRVYVAENGVRYLNIPGDGSIKAVQNMGARLTEVHE